MLSFLFGKKKKKHSVIKQKGRKPPSRLIKLCKKYHIKLTRKVGRRRVYKKVSVLKKQLKKKMKGRKVHTRRSRFGFNDLKNIQHIKKLIIQLQMYMDGDKNADAGLVINSLNNFLKDKSHYPEISISADAYTHAVDNMERGSPNYLQKQRILGGLIAKLTVYKNCEYTAQDDYDDFERCGLNKQEMKDLILGVLTTVLGLKKGVDFSVNGTSFGKRRRSRSSQFGKFNFGDTNKIEDVKDIYRECFPQIPESSLDQIISNIKRSSYEHFEKEIFNARNNKVALSTSRLQMYIKQYLENKLTYAQLLSISEPLFELLIKHNGSIKENIDRQYHKKPTGKYKPGALERIIEFGKRH